MKLVKQYVELVEQGPGIEGMYNAIEDAARICYKSSGRLGKEFVDKLIKKKHTAVLEHGTVYLSIPIGPSFKDDRFVEKYTLKHFFLHNQYSRCVQVSYYDKDTCPTEFKEMCDNWEGVNVCYITTSFRIILDNFKDIDEVLKYWSEPTKYHPKRISMKIVCDRINSQSFMRHRRFSFAQESTRYCNYNNDKFDNEVSFVIPYWYKYGNGTNDRECSMDSEFENCCRDSEKSYLRMIQWGAKPQEARQVLINALKTEFIMTGFADDWKHFLDVRTTNTYGTPHPDMMDLALMIKSKIQDKIY